MGQETYAAASTACFTLIATGVLQVMQVCHCLLLFTVTEVHSDKWVSLGRPQVQLRLFFPGAAQGGSCLLDF